jgi:hypothetical protein
MPSTIFRFEDHEHDQPRDGDQQDRGEQQVVLSRELALEVQQSQSIRGIWVPSGVEHNRTAMALHETAGSSMVSWPFAIRAAAFGVTRARC